MLQPKFVMQAPGDYEIQHAEGEMICTFSSLEKGRNEIKRLLLECRLCQNDAARLYEALEDLVFMPETLLMFAGRESVLRRVHHAGTNAIN